MTAHWTPTVRTYLGRVTKALILDAVREAVSGEAADRIASMKKQPMAEAAEQLLAGTGWLPPLMRTAPVAGSVGWVCRGHRRDRASEGFPKPPSEPPRPGSHRAAPASFLTSLENVPAAPDRRGRNSTARQQDTRP